MVALASTFFIKFIPLNYAKQGRGTILKVGQNICIVYAKVDVSRSTIMRDAPKSLIDII